MENVAPRNTITATSRRRVRVDLLSCIPTLPLLGMLGISFGLAQVPANKTKARAQNIQLVLWISLSMIFLIKIRSRGSGAISPDQGPYMSGLQQADHRHQSLLVS